MTTAALAATGADGRDCRNIGTYGRGTKFGADLEQVQDRGPVALLRGNCR